MSIEYLFNHTGEMIMTYNNRTKIEELRKIMVDNTSNLFDAQIQLSEQLLAIYIKEFESIVQKNKRDIENYVDGKILLF